MATIDAAHGPIEYEVEGDEAGDPILLVTGLGAQLVRWSATIRNELLERGHRVIRLDNRDAGLSHHHHDSGRPHLKKIIAALAAGEAADIPYTLHDMAGDAVTLMDALGVERAHVVGTSMGGFIAQHLAFGWPDRVKSLTLIMTNSGNPGLRSPDEKVLAVLAERSNPNEDRATQIERNVVNQTVIGSPGYPFDPDALRRRIKAEMERGGTPESYARQRAAILADGDRRERVAKITAPTLVLHGEADPLIPVDGGIELAQLIPGARLILYPGMGHEIPEQLAKKVAVDIAEHAAAAP